MGLQRSWCEHGVLRASRTLVAGLVVLGLVTANTAARAQPTPDLSDFQAGRFAEAYQSWSRAAESGNAEAALYVGVLYDTGFGVSQSREQALKWYRMGAEGGNVTAMLNLAVLYDSEGRGSDPGAAVLWYRRAAERGNGRAEFNLGLIYEGGAGVAADRALATSFFTAAAHHGIPAAYTHLVRLGHPFAGAVQRHDDPAMRAFEQAQQALLRRGSGDAAQAVVLFQRAASEGNPLAEYDLGYCYEHGLGVQVDVSQAVTWYRRAASHAQTNDVRTISEASARKLSDQISHAVR